MRVLLINHRFFPAEGGTERWTLGLGRALRGRGHSVSVLTQEEPGRPSEEEIEGLQVIRLPLRRVGGFRVPRGYWRRLRGLEYDVLHLSGNRIWCADFLFPVARIFPRARVVTPHDFYQWAMDPSPLNRWYFARYLPRVLRGFQAYLALTRAEAERVVGFGYPRERVHVVGEGFEIDRFPPQGERFDLRGRGLVNRPHVALYVGGLWPNKRVDRLVEALAPLREELSLVVVGQDRPGGPHDRKSVESRARERGLEVAFTGAVPNEQLPGLYRAADVYVQGSQYEGFGISLLEAMASGVPFVAYDTGAARELTQGGGGVVASSPEEFAAAVRAWLSDPDRRAGAARAARATAEEYRWERVVDRYLSVYEEALRR